MKPNRNRGGVFISVEGPDGAGKTTQLQMLQDKLEEHGLEAVMTREPGGTVIGEQIRKILLDPKFTEMTVICEVLLYSAARAQLVAEVIRPALLSGQVVLCDRFVDSSTVYQGYAGAEDPGRIKEINLWAVGGLLPDRTILLNIDAEAGLDRLRKKRQGPAPAGDRMEQKALAFHRRVQEGFLQLASQEADRFCIIDAAQDLQAVHRSIWEDVRPLLQERALIT